MMKKILITGGTGFVGGHLTKLLQQTEPESELHLTSLHGRPAEGKVTVHGLDLTKQEALITLIKELQPEEIYHLASLASVADSFAKPAEVTASNFMLTLNLLETVRLQAPQAKVLLVSSADIYDHAEATAIAEDRLVAPVNPYSASKAAQDLLGQTYWRSFGAKVVIVRPFNHIGPGQRTGFVVADFASQIAQLEADGKPAQLRVGNLQAARDFSDVRDVVKAYQLLMQKGNPGEIYNLGSGKSVTIESILEQLLALTEAKIDVVVDQEKFRPVDAPLIVANPAKIEALGWSAQIPLSETLGDILNYWRGIIKKQTK